MSRRDLVGDAVAGLERAEIEFRDLVETLEGTVESTLDSYTPAHCRFTAELMRDIAAKADIALARLRLSAGMLAALAMLDEEARHGS